MDLSLTTALDQRAIETLLNLAEKYARHSQDLSKQGTGTVKDVRGNDSVRTVETNLRVSSVGLFLFVFVY